MMFRSSRFVTVNRAPVCLKKPSTSRESLFLTEATSNVFVAEASGGNPWAATSCKATAHTKAPVENHLGTCLLDTTLQGRPQCRFVQLGFICSALVSRFRSLTLAPSRGTPTSESAPT